MIKTKRLILDILKPHKPNALEFAKALAELGEKSLIRLTVEAVDEKTETVAIEIEAEDIDFSRVSKRISELGGVNSQY